MKRIAITASAIALVAGAASAQTMATATTDLNVRSGPGAWHEVVGVIPGGAEANVESCYIEANWCKVSHEGTEGWSYGAYLTVGEEPVSVVAPEVVEQPETYTITRLEVDDDSAEAAAVGFGWGAIAGSLIAGPAGAAIGSVATAAFADAQVDPVVIEYVQENPVEPVYLNGELVVGAGIPQEVEVHSFPDHSEWAYVNVNGTPVIIEADSRRIVTIVN